MSQDSTPRGVGDRLRQLRGEKTLQAFAAEIGEPYSNYWHYEKGEKVHLPPDEFLRRAAKVAGRSFEWLKTGMDPASERLPMAKSAGGDRQVVRFTVIFIDRAGGLVTAIVPALPGIGVTGQSRTEVEEQVVEAIEKQLAKLHRAGKRIEPEVTIAQVEVDLPPGA